MEDVSRRHVRRKCSTNFIDKGYIQRFNTLPSADFRREWHRTALPGATKCTGKIRLAPAGNLQNSHISAWNIFAQRPLERHRHFNCWLVHRIVHLTIHAAFGTVSNGSICSCGNRHSELFSSAEILVRTAKHRSSNYCNADDGECRSLFIDFTCVVLTYTFVFGSILLSFVCSARKLEVWIDSFRKCASQPIVLRYDEQ